MKDAALNAANKDIWPGIAQPKKFNPRKPQKPSYIKMVQNQEYDNEEPKEYKEQEEEPQEQDEIDNLVSRMVSFSDEKKVQWMNAMQDRGVDFLAA